MPTPATYITYRELFDRVPTSDELDSIIKGLNAFNTVVLTARLNTMYRHSVGSKNPEDANSVDKFQYWFASAFFDSETKHRLSARFGEEKPTRRPVCYPCRDVKEG